MIVLNFTVRNHRSVRDEVTLDLTRPSLRTLQPKDGAWGSVAYPIVGIFGANAAGKSAVIDALWYVFEAVRRSATSWQDGKAMYRTPFRLDGSSSTAPSLYELHFVHHNRRHCYGFEVDDGGVVREWLRDVPASRWRTLLDRDRDAGRLRFHEGPRARIAVTSRELVLSRALLLPESPLHTVARDLADAADAVLVKHAHRASRLAAIADSLAEGSIGFGDLEALLRVADIGVVKVGLREENVPEHIRRALRQLLAPVDSNADAGVAGDTGDAGQVPELAEDDSWQVARSLEFTHRGSFEESPQFSIHDESDGTLAWLALAVPALEALRAGSLLIVDEIDSSLHPQLLDVLLDAFADETINRAQAQLIFTSHEPYLLSPQCAVQLQPEQVWLTEKTYQGVTELVCLADFPRHPDANVAQRYLAGRYGGTPRLAPSEFAALVERVER